MLLKMLFFRVVFWLVFAFARQPQHTFHNLFSSDCRIYHNLQDIAEGLHRHLRSAGRGQLDVPRVGPSAWNALPDFLKTIHFLCLLLDASLNISTSHFTSTPSAFEVILQLACYINCLLTVNHSLH